MDVRKINANLFIQNEEGCLNIIQKEWHKLPLLNCNEIHMLHDQKLVRFRGMVQDMYNPEYYFEKYEIINELTTETSMRDGKYMDTFKFNDKEMVNTESDHNVTGERHTFVLISEPGLNSWAEEVNKSKIVSNGSDLPSSSSPSQKRVLEEDVASMECNTEAQSSSTDNKRQCTSISQTNQAQVVSKEHLLNFPLPDRTGKAIHLKLYKNSDDLKLNEIIECVGFLSLNSGLESFGDDEHEELRMEEQTHNPPPSLIPRIHCVSYKKIKNHDHYLASDETQSTESIKFVRSELHTILTQLLLGDTLAAEYLIYHLISRIYVRQDLMAIGKFSLNISNIPTMIEGYGQKLYDFIAQLIPKSHYLPLTLENMNDLTFIPKKDYNCNRITSGILQLSSNTHLVLDETKLTAGKLNEAGIRATAALTNVIKFQKTPYDFNYYHMEFECDIPFLVLSEGKSLLPSDCHVVLKPDDIYVNTFDEIIEATKIYLKPVLLEAIRIYLMQRRFAKYEISNEIHELVQKDFVEMREKWKATADDLHNLLVLARLVCLADGKETLDAECWQKAANLEENRKDRLK